MLKWIIESSGMMVKVRYKLKPMIKQRMYQAVIIINILWIILLACYYSFRLIYYYKLEHQTSAKTNLLVDTLLLDKNVVAEGDGLYHEDKHYVYKGKVTDNYVTYSGLRWRILGIDEDHNIRMVTDEAMTTLYYGTKGYDSSYVRNWLVPQNELEHTGIFLENLSDSVNLLTKTRYCIDTIDNIRKVTCKHTKEDMVTLLSLSDYEEAKGKNSFLNNGIAFYTTSTDTQKHSWIVGQDGSVVAATTNGSSYDVRPVVTLKHDVILYSGDGTLQNPYRIENKQKITLKDINVGEYLNYSGSRYRVIDKYDDKIKIILDGTLNDFRVFERDSTEFDQNSYGSVAYYLNQYTIGNYEHPEWLKSGIFYTGVYNEDNDYNYVNTYLSHTEAYIGLPQVGDYFVSTYNDTYTLTPAIPDANTIVSIAGGKLYADIIDTEKDIRPVLFLDNTLKISGNGTQDSPYEVMK